MTKYILNLRTNHAHTFTQKKMAAAGERKSDSFRESGRKLVASVKRTNSESSRYSKASAMIRQRSRSQLFRSTSMNMHTRGWLLGRVFSSRSKESITTPSPPTEPAADAQPAMCKCHSTDSFWDQAHVRKKAAYRR